MNGKLTKWPGVFKETKKKTFKEAEEVDEKLQESVQQFVDETFKHLVCYAFLTKGENGIRLTLEPVEECLENPDCILVVNDKFKNKLQSFLNEEYPDKYIVRKQYNTKVAYSEGYCITFYEK